MPLTGTEAVLSQKLQDAFNAATAAYKTGDSSKYLNTLCDNLAKSIITHIVSNAEIITTVAGTSPSGPITGTGKGNVL